MKKILFFILSLFLFSSAFSINLRGCYKKYIKFSSYYSPIYGQKFYYKGNYYLERRLNGYGIRGASGKRVFNGMLAAPKNYKFGTKIYIPGLGVGQVEDRGSAIVNAGKRGEKYDRVDIWVGKGDKALMRALSFGKQVKLARICPPTKRLKVGFNYRKFPILKGFFKRTLWSIGLYSGRRDNWVRTLQTHLIKLGYMKHKPTGFFGKLTKKALTRFQKDYNIDKRYYGYFGPKTRYIMKQLIEGKKLKVLKKIDIQKKLKKDKEKKKINNELAILKRGLGKGYNTYEVTILQKYLKKLGYYKGKVDGYYDKQTLEAVAKFQMEQGIIKKGQTYLAGYFGPLTRTKFKQVVKNKFINL